MASSIYIAETSSLAILPLVYTQLLISLEAFKVEDILSVNLIFLATKKDPFATLFAAVRGSLRLSK